MKNKALAFCVAAFCIASFLPYGKSVGRAEGYAQAECVMELESRRILSGKHLEEKLPMASTTKIVTAICVLEHCKNPDTPFKIPKSAEGVEGSSVYLKAGDEYTPEELLYGLMLRSGNDCAEALAYHVSGDLKAFSLLMNETAQKAGALNSSFITPHGLHDDNHYTTAQDLSMITCYALHNPTFREIVSTKYFAKYGWTNKNKMLYRFDGAIGVKTGYTKKAGRCLVSAATRDGMTLVCTVLNCYDTYGRSTTLLTDAFSAYRNELLIGVNERIELDIDGQKVDSCVANDCRYPLLSEEREYVTRKFFSYSKPFERDKTGIIVGKAEIYLGKQLIFCEKLYKL